MRRVLALGLAAMLASPAVAQQAPPGASPAPVGPTMPAGGVQKAPGGWRARTLVGAPVYSEAGQRIAVLDDVLLTDDGKAEQAVLAVVGQRGKRVTVPYAQLRFVPSNTPNALGGVAAEGAPATPALIGSELKTYAVILPGASRESLAKLAPYRFQ
jgi:PRC-barrel domain